MYTTHLGALGYVLGTRPNDLNGLHACVRESSITRELRQTFYSILERADCCSKVILENMICENSIIKI